MINTRTLPSAMLAVALLMASITSFILVISVALRIGVGPLAFPAFVAALGLQTAKMGLPLAAFKLWRRGDAEHAKGVIALWCVAFIACSAAAVAFASGPHAISDRSNGELLRRKVAALRSMERTRDTEEMDGDIARGYAKRIGELNRDIAELRAKPGEVIVAPDPASAQIAGVLAVINELLSAVGLLLLRLAHAPEGERLSPDVPAPAPPVAVKAAPIAEEPLLLLETGPAFLEAAAAVDPEKATTWLWPGVLPLGALTLLTGQPKVGKSQIAVAMAAITSTGGAWPTGQACEAGGVILAEVEDSFADTRARLMAAGADLGRIVIRDREAGPLDLSRPEGMAVLAAQAAAMGDVRLVVLSPLLAFFGRAGATDDATVRARLSGLLMWAAQNRVAVLGLMHPAKNPGKALEGQFAGADAYRRAARSAFVAMPDASDPEPIIKRKRRALICAGVNGWTDDQRYFYRIEGVQAAGAATSRVVWLPDVRLGDDDEAEAIADPAGIEGDAIEPDGVWPVRMAEVWLKGRLLKAEPTPSTAILEDALGAGFNGRTVRRAAKNIGVIETKSGRVGVADLWSLPVRDSVTV
jgi:hypothetical protein